MQVAPDKPRSTISEEPDGLRIEIPAKPNWPQVFALGMLFSVLILSVGRTLYPVLRSGIWRQGAGSRSMLPVFALPFLVFTFAFAAAALNGLWGFFGREIVLVNGMSLTIARAFGRLAAGSPKQFNLAEVHHLRVAPVMVVSPRSQASPWGNYGAVAFDYGAKTYRFGLGLDEAEASMLVQTMQQRFQSLR